MEAVPLLQGEEAAWWSEGGGAVSYERGTPVPLFEGMEAVAGVGGSSSSSHTLSRQREGLLPSSSQPCTYTLNPEPVPRVC